MNRVHSWSIRCALGVTVMVLAACQVKQPTLQTNADTLCRSKQAINTNEQTGARMADKTLALTFDDGPAEITGELSAYLKSEGIAATFFVNGANAEGQGAVMQQAIADGHLIGNHTQTHAALIDLPASDVVSEVELTDQLLSPLVPNGALYFRPPFGAWNKNVSDALTKSAMTKYKGPVFWDVGDQLTATSGADWDCWADDAEDGAKNGTRTVEQCGDLYLTEIRAKKHGIVLLHDGPPGAHGDKTLEMMRYVIPLLKAQQYKFARIDEVELAEPVAPGEEPTNGQKPQGPAGPPVDPCR
jgi:peptidoglycan-N-acetylglucosamine deacetylase